MNKFIIGFILTSIAGLSTILGYFTIFLPFKKSKLIAFALSMSSSVMITLSIVDLLPSAFTYLSNYNVIFKLLLILFFMIFGIFLSNYISHCSNETDNLKKIGIVSLITIIIHNIPEGIITFIVSGINLNLGLKLCIGIGLHNIPEGISIAIPLYYSTNKKIKTFIVVLIASLSEIFGAIICFIFFKNIINNFIIGITLSFVAGVMLNISIKELLKESFKYHEILIVIIGLIFGFVTMLISHIL